jgi:hypothetical protein
MAEVLNTDPETIREIGLAMGLPETQPITEDQWRRSYITIIRRNWHLLPYDQLLQLLDWTPEEMAFTLREDDFLWVKLGQLKPRCDPLVYKPPNAATQERENKIRKMVEEHFPDGVGVRGEPLFSFVRELSTPPATEPGERIESLFSPRYCYSYFALYGDPLLDEKLDPYPEGYLARLAGSGVNGVWLQGVLFKLAPFPWDESLSEGYQTRLENLRKLVAKGKKYGIGVYLYLNEPRSMPLSFFEAPNNKGLKPLARDNLKGVVENDYAAMCTSTDPVREYLREGIASISRAVPDLAGFFTITGSENLTNCWSHHQGQNCPRCGPRGPAEVISEVNRIIKEGIDQAGAGAELICWDWGWQDDWALETIDQLPDGVSFMSVSEWSIPIERGGVQTVIGEYSISTIGPGPRATRHWNRARAHGLKTLAKIQANNTWELSSVPYIPALENVAQHAANLREAGVDGLQLSWTLGGHPSPNLEVVAELGKPDAPSVDEALLNVARNRYGETHAENVVEAWKKFSEAFSEFPYHGGTMYNAPQQMGPANLLWGEPTGYRSTMVGFPYDDLDSWRAVYPPEVFVDQFGKVAVGFTSGAGSIGKESHAIQVGSPLWDEIQIAKACAIHFGSVVNQATFVDARDRLDSTTEAEQRAELLAVMKKALKDEIDSAKRLHDIQCQDSRIGFEATNQYFYIPVDLAEKVLNGYDLLERLNSAE